jgi:catechol 2,3-dioxygenase-like lactoylglutathione lyase family enzyme
MQLVELAYFTDNVDRMAEFYSRLLDTPPVARSEGMAIFMLGATKIFIHKRYTPAQGELPPENHIALAVEDVDSASRQLVEIGVVIEIPRRITIGVVLPTCATRKVT